MSIWCIKYLNTYMTRKIGNEEQKAPRSLHNSKLTCIIETKLVPNSLEDSNFAEIVPCCEMNSLVSLVYGRQYRGYFPTFYEVVPISLIRGNSSISLRFAEDPSLIRDLQMEVKLKGSASFRVYSSSILLANIIVLIAFALILNRLPSIPH